MPPLGGFNPTVLRIELRRMLRNRRTIFFALVFPAALFFAIGRRSGWTSRPATATWRRTSWSSMALYGAALIAASGGASVATERALGWSPAAAADPAEPGGLHRDEGADRLVLGAVAIGVVEPGRRSCRAGPTMPTHVWLACAGLTLVCTVVFAAFGVFVGYLVPGENAMQVLGPGLALLAFLGNVFIPITEGTRAVARRGAGPRCTGWPRSAGRR